MERVTLLVLRRRRSAATRSSASASRCARRPRPRRHPPTAGRRRRRGGAHPRGARAHRRQRRARGAAARSRPQRAPPPHAPPRHRAPEPGRAGRHRARRRARPGRLRRRRSRRSEPRWEQKPVAVLAIDRRRARTHVVEPWTARAALGDDDRRARRRLRRRRAWHARRRGSPPSSASRARSSSCRSAPCRRRSRSSGSLGEHDPRPELRIAVHVGAVRVDAAAPDAPARAPPDRRHARAAGAPARPRRAGRDPGVARGRAGASRRGCELRAARAPPRRGGHAHGARRRRARGAAPATAEPRAGADALRRRERELGAPARELRERGRPGTGQVVFVVGEAGHRQVAPAGRVPRARLGDEPHLLGRGTLRLVRHDDARSCRSSTRLRRFFGIDDRDDEASARRQGRARRSRALGADLAWTLPFVRQVLGLAARRRGRRRARLRQPAQRDVPRAEGADAARAPSATPLVLVVEDLHWIDPASEEFLGFLADAVPTTRALLVCSHRPGYRHPLRRPQLPRPRRAAAAVGARRWRHDRRAARARRTCPPRCSALIARQGRGQSVLRRGGDALAARGRHAARARTAASSWRATRPRSRCPTRIQDVLIARLDRLADDARRAIQVASVIGREFALRLLERITEAGEHVRTQVEELRALELIYEKAAHPELAYMFKHALTHDVAYESVLARAPARAAPHDRARDRGALRRPARRALRDAGAPLRARRGLGAGARLPRARRREGGRELRQPRRRSPTAGRRSRSPTGWAPTCRDERRRALEEQLGARVLLRERVRRVGRGVRARGRAQRRPGHARARPRRAGFSFFWGNATTRARRCDRAALRARAAPRAAPAAEALAVANAGFFRGVCEATSTAEAARDGARSRSRRAPATRRCVALIRFNLAQVAEWTRRLPARDRDQRARRSPPAAASASRTWSIWPAGSSARRAAASATTARAIAQLTEACEVCDRIGDRAWKSRLLNTLGWCFAEIGSHRARPRVQRARRGARARDRRSRRSSPTPRSISPPTTSRSATRADARPTSSPSCSALARPGDPWMRWRYALHAQASRGPPRAPGAGDPSAALAHAHAEVDGARAPPCAEGRGAGARARGRRAARHGRAARARTTALVGAIGIADTIGYPRRCGRPWRRSPSWRAGRAVRRRRRGTTSGVARCWRMRCAPCPRTSCDGTWPPRRSSEVMRTQSLVTAAARSPRLEPAAGVRLAPRGSRPSDAGCGAPPHDHERRRRRVRRAVWQRGLARHPVRGAAGRPAALAGAGAAAAAGTASATRSPPARRACSTRARFGGVEDVPAGRAGRQRGLPLPERLRAALARRRAPGRAAGDGLDPRRRQLVGACRLLRRRQPGGARGRRGRDDQLPPRTVRLVPARGAARRRRRATLERSGNFGTLDQVARARMGARQRRRRSAAIPAT